MAPAPYCDSCFKLFKMLDACPRSYIFDEDPLLPKILEVLWVSASIFPWVIYLGLFLYAIFARTSRVFFISLSLMLQQLLNDGIVKRLLAESRPSGACSTSYGLPSGHSSFTASWAVLLTLEWLLYHDKVPFKTGRFHGLLRTIGILVTPLIPISRHFLNYHTPKQIFCGLAMGSVVTSLYFYTMMAVMHKDNGKFWGSKIARLFKRLGIKDNIVLYGAQLEDLLTSQADLEEQQLNQESSDEGTTPLKESYMILPLKKKIRYYLWKKLPRSMESSGSSEKRAHGF